MMTIDFVLHLQGLSAMTLQQKLLKYGKSYGMRSIPHAVLDEIISYLALMITSIRWCVARNDL